MSQTKTRVYTSLEMQKTDPNPNFTILVLNQDFKILS